MSPIAWIKLEAGEYRSTCGRFHVIRAYTRSYGDNTWNLHGMGENKHTYPSFRELKRDLERMLARAGS